jgi:hypothetical protein
MGAAAAAVVVDSAWMSSLAAINLEAYFFGFICDGGDFVV